MLIHKIFVLQFYRQWEKGPETPIHHRPTPGRFEKDEFGRIVRIQVSIL
jgi:hypothetical protein